jgi:hypothetical protein
MKIVIKKAWWIGENFSQIHPKKQLLDQPLSSLA